MLFIGYLEGFQSERSIAWHCADRMSLRDFLGYQLHERTPDHSSFTIWRQRLPLELYRTVFQRILGLVHRHGLVDAYAAGVDSLSHSVFVPKGQSFVRADKLLNSALTFCEFGKMVLAIGTFSG